MARASSSAVAAARVHPTALIEPHVTLGEGTSVWDHVHIRQGARIGARCIIGEKTYIAYDVVIGDLVKINAMVYVCAGVTIEAMAMIAAGTVFTNDKLPRAADPQTRRLLSSSPTVDMLHTRVCTGATIGANATIGPGLTIGAWAMVGMGSVVTRDVLDHQLVMGSPARPAGWVCVCGQVLGRRRQARWACRHCARRYRMSGPRVRLLTSSSRGSNHR